MPLQVFAAVAGAPGIVHAVDGPTLDGNGRYCVELSPLGFENMPYTEARMKHALKKPLAGLEAMHEAGFGHGDIRKPNMLCDDEVDDPQLQCNCVGGHAM